MKRMSAEVPRNACQLSGTSENPYERNARQLEGYFYFLDVQSREITLSGLILPFHPLFQCIVHAPCLLGH